ncbi:MAG: ATP-dependent Clp protease adaptor ClpS [Candidatus Hydrogenedentes bacterium]|nr:ATP-dependent Clp protease adaptor ClpS [Candidatus Hydrogenedentota bacterium]
MLSYCLGCGHGRARIRTLRDPEVPEYISSPGTSAETKVREELKAPDMFRVLMHNDDYTTMDFVVHVLRNVFCKPTEEAVRIMLNIHHEGVGVCGVFTADIAETKIASVHAQAEAQGYPLRCSMEPA